jgi:hypothetical protein
MPNVFLRDMQQVSKSLVDMATALMTGQQEGWIDKKVGGKLFRTALSQLGVEVEAPTSDVDISGLQPPGSPGTPEAGTMDGAPETPTLGSYQTSLERRARRKMANAKVENNTVKPL